jgi:glycogen debranching enzyme
MSRCLGKIDRWPEVLKNQRELGYNAIHFAPIQTYGASESHYSIANQLEVDDCYFTGKHTGAEKLAKLE